MFTWLCHSSVTCAAPCDCVLRRQMMQTRTCCPPVPPIIVSCVQQWLDSDKKVLQQLKGQSLCSNLRVTIRTIYTFSFQKFWGYFGKLMITQLYLSLIWWKYTSLGSSWNFLSKVFWVQLDRTKHSAANNFQSRAISKRWRARRTLTWICGRTLHLIDLDPKRKM